MVLGSVPMAFFGAYLLHADGPRQNRPEKHRAGARRRAARRRRRDGAALRARPHDPATAARRPSTTSPRARCARSRSAMVGGVVVGITSVGSGSLMIIMLLFLYPMIGAKQLVGTDLTQAVPLTTAAALGALAFGHVEFGVTTSLIIGSVPAVFVGSMLSSSAPDRYIRPAITFVIVASGLKYVGVGDDRARLDPVRRAARRRRQLGRGQAAVAEDRRRRPGARGSRAATAAHRRTRGRADLKSPRLATPDGSAHVAALPSRVPINGSFLGIEYRTDSNHLWRDRRGCLRVRTLGSLSGNAHPRGSSSIL